MRLARVNSLLLAAIILVNAYIILLPFLPGIVFWVQGRSDQSTHKLEAEISPSAAVIPADNRLIMPSILFNQPVYDGPTTATLKEGLWHLPFSSSPTNGGNTVIIGHRFTYTNPEGVLYNLDKVHVGDIVGLWWNRKLYRYTVTTTEVTGPTDAAVQAPTQRPELTIYTCTPLWLPKNRLVVIAQLETGNV